MRIDMEIDRNIPIWQLSVGQFMDLMAVCNAPANITQKIEDHDDVITGLKGLANLLHVSLTTAQNLKNSGKLDGTFTQYQRTIYFSRKRVMAALSGDNKKK